MYINEIVINKKIRSGIAIAGRYAVDPTPMVRSKQLFLLSQQHGHHALFQQITELLCGEICVNDTAKGITVIIFIFPYRVHLLHADHSFL